MFQQKSCFLLTFLKNKTAKHSGQEYDRSTVSCKIRQNRVKCDRP
ncbi:hypothetical protein QUA83_06410 [Microcoleus sp. K1-B1]